MQTFIYKARDETGKPVGGLMDALSPEELAKKLRAMGYTPTTLRPASPGMSLEDLGEKFKRIRREDMIMFNIQLANMISSGLSILTSLLTISQQIENKKLKEIVQDLARSVEGGSCLSDALAKHPRIFSRLFISTVRVGEASGNLDAVLNRLAAYLEQQEELRQKIRGALFYPAILLAAGIGVILFIVSFVIPRFVVIFDRAGVALPLPTVVLHAAGTGLKDFWHVIIAFIALGFTAARAYIRSPKGRLRFDRNLLKLPVLGPLARKIFISRFSRMLATLLDSGVGILQSLDIIRDVVGSEVIARVISSAREAVERGESIAKPLKISREFPPDIVQMIAVGEETGRLGPMLNKAADLYDTAAGYSIKKLATLIEPVFLVVMGSMVGFIMASLLLPIFDMVKTIG